MVRSAVIVISALALVASVAFAGQLKDIVIPSKVKGVRNCAGGKATIDGNHNTLKLKNCKTVTVNGNHNKLKLVGAHKVAVDGNHNHVGTGVVKSISVQGNKNTVRYKVGPKKKRPRISNLGKGNSVRRVK